MDVHDFQKRIADFLVSQATKGPGVTEEAEALRRELDVAIAEYGETIPELEQFAAQLDLLKEVASNQDLADLLAEQAMSEYEPDPPVFDAISDGNVAAVVAALEDWEINTPHGEFQTTALYKAMSCMFGVSLDVVRLLLDRGADPNLGLGTKTNVLHGLGFGRCDDVDPNELAEVIRRCVVLGADIEQRSERLKWTPLITAASEWNPVAVEALVLAGADIHARAGDISGVCFAGETARAFAEGHEATVAVFDRYLNSV